MGSRWQHLYQLNYASLTAEERSSCKDEVLLKIQGRKFTGKGCFGLIKSGSFLAFYRQNEDGSTVLVHRTEVIKNSPDPQWKPFSLPLGSLCRGDRQSPFLIKCVNWKREGSEKHMGEAQTTVEALLKLRPTDSLTLRHQHKDKQTGLLMIAEAEVRRVHSFLDFVDAGMQISCTVAIDFTQSNGLPADPKSLHYIDPTGRPNPYLRALRAVGEVIQDYGSDQMFPVYGFGARLPPDGRVSHQFNVNFMRDPNCHGIDSIIAAYQNCIRQVELYGPTNFSPIINEVAGEKHMGEAQTTVEALLKLRPTDSLTLRHQHKDKQTGLLMIAEAEVRRVHSFLDFVDAGMQISCTVAIDFTQSNGLPADPKSLHYIDPTGRPNPYLRALRAVGEVIQDYGSDQMFPVYGFGARLPPDGRVSHQFNVNFMRDPNCHGIDSIIAAYQNCIRQVELYGPTNFSPIINEVAGNIRESRAQSDGLAYQILLIITDGVITDMESTIDAIIAAATLPLSIIIVGVGDADFGAMKTLNGDYTGRVASRDIVQFVAFRDFIAQSPQSLQVSQALLAREVLLGIPGQVVSYMRVRGIAPGSWPHARQHRLSSISDGQGPGAFVPTMASMPQMGGEPQPLQGGQTPSAPQLDGTFPTGASAYAQSDYAKNRAANPNSGAGSCPYPPANEPPPPYDQCVFGIRR